MKKQKREPEPHRFNVGDTIRDGDTKWIVGTITRLVRFSNRQWAFYIVRRSDGSETPLSDTFSELVSPCRQHILDL